MSAWRHVVNGREEPSAIGGETEDVDEGSGDEIAEGAIRALAGIQAGIWNAGVGPTPLYLEKVGTQILRPPSPGPGS